MAKARSKPKNPFIGTWHIVSASNWDEDQEHEETDAYIEFDENSGGSFELGDLHGFIDHYRTKKKDRQRAIQFGWHGEDEEGMPVDDIGWALLEEGELRGTICRYLGEEEIEFVAKKESQKTLAAGDTGQGDSLTRPANLFAGLPLDLPDELVTTLLDASGVHIERIVSQGHASPEGFWHDQDQHEWVIVLKGAAQLRFEDEIVELKPGDFVDIPAHRKHRVEWTTPDQPTVWLAIFFAG